MWKAIVLVATIASAARAGETRTDETHTDGTEISFTDATGFVARLPELVGARDAARMLDVAAARLPLGWSPLIVRLMPQVATGTPRGAGVRLGIEQAVPLTSRRAAARATIAAEARQRAARVAALTIEARLEIARAWIDSWTAEATFLEAKHVREIAKQIVETTERGLAAGAATTPELADARGLLASADTAMLDAEGRAKDASFRLGAAVGATGPRRATGELPQAVLPDGPPELDDIPTVRALRMEAVAARARAAEARALRAPELLVGGELTLDPGSDQRVAATIGVAWPLHDRGERERAEALAEATRLDGEAAAAARRARLEVAQALHDVEHSGELLAKVEHELVPAVEDAAGRRRRAYDLGESTVIEVLSAERAAITGRQTAIAARAGHAWARVRARALLDAGAER